MHTTSLLPWDDHKHRRYFYATDKRGKVLQYNNQLVMSLIGSAADRGVGDFGATCAAIWFPDQILALVP